MAIPESQLDTWSKLGSITQSQATYATVRGCLEAKDAPYSNRSHSIFLQGSYGNDTNIYADSDVDIVILTDSVYYNDLSDLNPEEVAAYNAVRSDGSYTYNQFKRDVTTHLTNKFGTSVKPGTKAIFIEGAGNRRDTDVLPAVEHRRYTRFRSYSDRSFVSGITFWTSDGVRIINYPKQHSQNMTAKHQATGGWLKPTVRIFKNMRNSMVAKGYLKEGIAPSYFIEGMLYNVPTEKFVSSYGDVCVNAINWLVSCDRAKLLCANEQYYLLHPTSPVTWRAENLQTYLDAVVKFWKEW